MHGDRYQIALIILGITVASLLGFFLYQEMFPEYRIYQNDYIDLEKFRSTYTGEAPPAFAPGIKQIVFEREDKGPASVDRCISCHVAVQIPHFSPMKIAYGPANEISLDAEGFPILEPNENYIFARLDRQIGEIKKDHPEEAEALAKLKTAKVNDQVYDITKVLAMHPLMGKETYPFEFHPLEEFGCTSCHSGNGKGLTTEKAHGPVFDGQYGIEHRGYVPEFIEKDERNDPSFAHVFNHKPDDSLLFQTTPILVGNLIQSSCIQCHSHHLDNVNSLKNSSSASSDVDLFTKNYSQGEQLYFSQSCYACHKIAGLSRGGVGPELTKAGFNYPWYLKESIVWPQADLPTSTMPNFRLDHVELEDLMTFLLAQKGAKKTESEIGYKLSVQNWEAGRKSPFEMAILPYQIDDLRYSMTIFATEGCASCHRLTGFISNTGYSIEKSNPQRPFDDLYREKQWFRRLFPEQSFNEELFGSRIVKTIEANLTDIDKRIVNDVRKNSLLEEIEAAYPHVIDSFYSNFRYASRAKNEEYRNDPKKLKEWQDRVHRILLVYIQEYGLGRLIGPRLNWSGIYRSDEWLMEHFRKPSGHTPRSIMPVFPFDTSKFLALTHMLDVLGKRNRDNLNAVWEHLGFEPELAYQTYCSQCHGNYLQGNGPVSKWIYPIPKNLTSGEFLRNLTKKNAILSITHGVKGTSMPPFGETPADKETRDTSAVLSQENIGKLVDWLYQSLSGARVIKEEEDVPKWSYSPKDVVAELDLEKALWLSKSNPFPQSVEEVFDIVPNRLPNGDKNAYYIKRQYYTPENLTRGEQFFVLNCAYCHGTDADGLGIRAGGMVDAKPRMLTNIDWLNTYDDLFLLRSIKYGVKGTAMTPWGDLTNATQRLQLVMYIRHLSFNKERRTSLFELLYQIFDEAIEKIEKLRMITYPSLAALQREEDSIQQKLSNHALQDDEALTMFQKSLHISREIKTLQEYDQTLLDLKKSLGREQTVYSDLGNSFIAADVDDELWKSYLAFVKLNENRFQLENKNLSINKNYGTSQQRLTALDQLKTLLEAQIARDKDLLVQAKGKLPSNARDDAIDRLHSNMSVYEKLKTQLITEEAKAEILRKQQLSLLQKEKYGTN